jgi:hypothetical protein
MTRPLSPSKTPLTTEEFSALKMVKAGLLIPEALLGRLKGLKLIDQRLGGWTVTMEGELRLGMGK